MNQYSHSVKRKQQAACRLLWHPAFRSAGLRLEGIDKLLVQELPGQAAGAAAERLVDEDERWEELIRRALAAGGLLLPGEDSRQAQDRLAQVRKLRA